MAQLKRLSVRLVLLLSVFAISVATFGQTTEIHFVASGYPAALRQLMTNVIIPAFEEETGIKVVLDHVNWNLRAERIALLHAGGIPPDVVSTGHSAFYSEGGSGMLAPLTEYVNRWEMQQFIPQPIWDAQRWQGELYTIPQWFDIRGVAYNRNAFADGGLDPDNPPQNWPGLVDAARRLTRLDPEGHQVLQRGFDFQYNQAQNLLWFIFQAGGDPVDLVNQKSNLDSPEALEALLALRDLARSSELQLPGPRATDIVSGRTAMTFVSPHDYGTWQTIQPEAADYIAVFPPRKSPDFEPAAINYMNGLAIPSASTKKDAAWQWIAYLYRDDVQRRIHEVTGWVGPRVDLVTDLLFLPGIEYFYNLVAYTKAPIIPAPRDISQTELATLVSQVLDGTMPPEEALLRAHELWTRLLRESGI